MFEGGKHQKRSGGSCLQACAPSRHVPRGAAGIELLYLFTSLR
jgi:hypothetical protein